MVAETEVLLEQPSDELTLRPTKPKPVVPPPFKCNYDDENCIELFLKIREKKWDEILAFLKTGNWPGFSLLPDGVHPKAQCMTAITCYERNPRDGTFTSVVRWNRLPLQQAVMEQAPFEVVLSLAEQYPDAIRWANRDGQLAIHLALLYEASDTVIAFLVQAYPESVNIKTNQGFTPIQAALKAKNKSRGVALSVFSRYTNLPNTKPIETPAKYLECNYDEESCTDLYKKVESADWDALVQYLDTSFLGDAVFLIFHSEAKQAVIKKQAKTWVTRYDSATGKALWSHLPLHLAILGHAPYDVTSRLLDAYPKAALCFDHQGMLPIHLAMASNADTELVVKLLLLCPESVNVKSPGGLTPLDCALAVTNDPCSRAKMLELFVTKITPKEVTIKEIESKISKAEQEGETEESREDSIVEQEQEEEETLIESENSKAEQVMGETEESREDSIVEQEQEEEDIVEQKQEQEEERNS